MDIRITQRRNSRNSEQTELRERRALDAEREQAERVAKNSARLKELRLNQPEKPKVKGRVKKAR